jgi:hypothetical protein
MPHTVAVLARRYYEILRRCALALEQRAAASVLLGLRDALPGTALGADFPGAAALRRAGYAAREDLAGAELDELLEAGLSRAEADAVLALVGEER